MEVDEPEIPIDRLQRFIRKLALSSYDSYIAGTIVQYPCIYKHKLIKTRHYPELMQYYKSFADSPFQYPEFPKHYKDFCKWWFVRA